MEINSRRKYKPSADDIATTNRVLNRLRDSFEQGVAVQVAVLEQAKTALLAGSLDQEQKQRAMHEAHKLAGALGTFGYPEGSKLGLAIEQLLMNDRTLTPEEVCRFSQLMAALQQELTKSPITSTSSAVSPVQNHQVLIVGERTMLVEKLQAAAELWDIQIKITSNLKTARSRIALAPPDAVLLDLSFPDMEEDGLTLLRELTQRSPQIPVIVFTVRDNLGDRLAGSGLGAQQFLHQPATTAQIFQAITRALPPAQTTQTKV